MLKQVILNSPGPDLPECSGCPVQCLHGASITEPLKVIVPPPASVVAIASAAKAEVPHIMPAAVMASSILLRIKNMSFERMRIIAHRLKTGINAKRSAKKEH
ncbi:hypothetical protein ACEF99_005389 [Salmonella enterica subsp. enterica serovar Newport]